MFDNKTPLHFACENGNFEIAKTLIERKADLNIRTTDGMTAMHFAVLSGKKDIVELLVAKGVEIKEKTNDGVLLNYFLIIRHSILHVKMKKELTLHNIFFRKELILTRKQMKNLPHFSLHVKIIIHKLLIFLLKMEQMSIAETKRTILFSSFDINRRRFYLRVGKGQLS